MESIKLDEPDQWQKTHYANLTRYVPSGVFFARIRVKGKLIRKSLKTDVLSVAKLRLADLEKSERQQAEQTEALITGKMSFGDALKVYNERLTGDGSVKPRTKAYHKECISKLLRTWPGLEATEVRKITKTACLQWAASCGKDTSASVFNHVAGILRKILEIAVDAGTVYDNPARFIKRHKQRPKPLRLPSPEEFQKFVKTIEESKVCSCYQAADLVRFLAYGGFRKSEAKNVTWADCDFTKKEITVRGDPTTGTKNSEVRRVPMIPEMVELLARLKEYRKSEERTNRVMLLGECQISMDRAAKKIGMSRITHHDLRHLFATTCIEAGVDIPTVSRWLGHKDGGALAMKVYGHLRDAHSASMAQKVSFNATTKHESPTSLSAKT